MDNINNKFKKGVLWSFVGKFGYLTLTFIVNIVFARLLTPKEFGTLAICMFFLALAKGLSESGLSGALIRKKDANNEDYSTIFIFNLFISIILYILIFASSGFIADYYNDLDLKLYIRVLSLVVIIYAFQIVQNVKLIKELRYKEISTATIFALIISSITSICLAYFNFGIWSLIIFQLLNALILTIILYLKVGRLEQIRFSKKSLKEMYSFGMYTTLSSLINTIYDNIYQMILGKYFSLNQTGLYYQAKKLSEVPVGIVQSASSGIVFATLSNLQDDKVKFEKFYNNIVRLLTVLLGLILLVVFLFSKEIILLIYGDKWIESSFYMKILIISSFFYMHEMFNRILFKVFNRVKNIFYLELFNKLIGLISIFIGVSFQNIYILMYGLLITSFLSYIVNYYISRTIYKSQNAYFEMQYTFKVLLVVFIISFVYLITIEKYSFISFYNLFYVPIVSIFYLVMLQFLKVFNFKKDLKSLR